MLNVVMLNVVAPQRRIKKRFMILILGQRCHRRFRCREGAPGRRVVAPGFDYVTGKVGLLVVELEPVLDQGLQNFLRP